MSQLVTFHRPLRLFHQSTVSLRLTPRRPRAAIPATQFPPQLESLFQSATGTQVTAGSLLGFATGYTAKRVGQLLLVLVGIQVVAVQLMAKRGWLVVDWDRVTEDLAPHVERNRVDRLWQIAKFRVPFAGAFSAGCYAGFRWT